MTTKNSAHTDQSSYRSLLIEHLFLGELLRKIWPEHAEVSKPQVDDSGYDLVLEAVGIIRHVRLRSSHRDATTSQQNVHQRLREKPSGCVVWIRFDPCTFDLGPYFWFGSPPGQQLPCLSGFKIARYTKGDSIGIKKPRPAIRTIPKGRFQELATIDKVIKKLFGEKCAE